MSKLLDILAIVLVGLVFPIHSAIAQELTLLFAESNLIGEISEIDSDVSTNELVNRYYSVLPETTQSALEQRWELMDRLIISYEVARTAADSAELTEVIADMDATWIEIQKIHSDVFTATVTQILDNAYSKLYPVL